MKLILPLEPAYGPALTLCHLLSEPIEAVAWEVRADGAEQLLLRLADVRQHMLLQ
jgi:hypothetical protein